LTGGCGTRGTRLAALIARVEKPGMARESTAPAERIGPAESVA